MNYALDTIELDVERVRESLTIARTGLVDRELIAEAIMLCLVAREHLLVIGAPGTAKSEAVRRVASLLGGGYFEYLLGRFTEPNEIFGPVDLRRLREGVVEIETSGMLPEAEVAFLDEVFLGSTAILNTLLGILNERMFRRGNTILNCPLRVCVGAANVLPDDPTLAAFGDRFLARMFVDPVADSRLEELLEAGDRSWTQPGSADGSLMAAVDRLAEAARLVSLDDVRPMVASAIRRMRGAGIEISDRRAVRAQRLIAAATALDTRTSACAADLWVLPLVAPTADTQALARDALAGLLAESANRTLIYSAEELSRGILARARRLASDGTALLTDLASGQYPDDGQLRVEAALREIDASLGQLDQPADLVDVRQRLMNALGR
ncbi:MAG: AAA family ATPase [Actinomycetota bacterium]|nr:AAA family ATPase [Actinomycetota bacterium]MDQ2955540.1 AAA family ATPase [Actinomycetota bacterium]